MNVDHWATVVQHARVQHGLVTSQQVVAASSESALRRALRAGLLIPARRGVHKVSGVPSSSWQSLMAVCLAAGPPSVASHYAAADLHGFPGILPGALEITAFGARTPHLCGVRSHASGLYRPQDRQTVLGIPTTSPARTVVDLAGRLSPFLLERAVEHVLRRSLCTSGELALSFGWLGGRGRPGTLALRRLLEDRLEVDSALETRWLRALRGAGVPPPAFQHQVVVDQRVLLLDFAWPGQRVGVEVDGWEPHRHRSAWDHDHDKVNAYQEAGWRVLFVTSNTSETKTIRQLKAFLAENPLGFRQGTGK